MLAPGSARTRLLSLFLQHGADPNMLEERGQPPIFSARENLDTERALLMHGANIELRNLGGDTPLLHFVCNHCWQPALLLLDRGADIDVQNKASMTLDFALQDVQESAVLLREALPSAYSRVRAVIERRRAAGTP